MTNRKVFGADEVYPDVLVIEGALTAEDAVGSIPNIPEGYKAYEVGFKFYDDDTGNLTTDAEIIANGTQTATAGTVAVSQEDLILPGITRSVGTFDVEGDVPLAGVGYPGSLAFAAWAGATGFTHYIPVVRLFKENPNAGAVVAGSHRVIAAGEFTTAGGDADETISVPGVLATDIVIAALHTAGASPETIVDASASADQIDVDFSGDPSNDHVVSYVVLRAN